MALSPEMAELIAQASTELARLKRGARSLFNPRNTLVMRYNAEERALEAVDTLQELLPAIAAELSAEAGSADADDD